MAALTAARVILVPKGSIKKFSAPLKAGQKAWENGLCCIDTASAGSVTPGAVSTTLEPIGWFTASVDNSASTAATAAVGVELFTEKEIQYWDSVTGAGAITASNLFQKVYVASDHELTTTSTGASPYGIVWSYNPQGYPNAVGVEAIPTARI